MLSPKLIIISILILSQSAFAGLDLGLVAGLSSANEIVSTPSGWTTNSEKYWAAGAFANLVFPQSEFGISTGLQYVQTGANLTEPLGGTVIQVVDSKIPYLQLPLTFNIWPTDWTSMGLGVYGGIPLVNANWDFGALVNGQIKIPVSVVTFLLLNVIYEYGLVNVDNTGNTIKNSTFILQGGVGLNF